MHDHNPSRTFRVPEYAWRLACETALQRGSFTRPSTIVQEFITLGVDAYERAKREQQK
jgi:hypothetical protein